MTYKGYIDLGYQYERKSINVRLNRRNAWHICRVFGTDLTMTQCDYRLTDHVMRFFLWQWEVTKAYSYDFCFSFGKVLGLFLKDHDRTTHRQRWGQTNNWTCSCVEFANSQALLFGTHHFNHSEHTLEKCNHVGATEPIRIEVADVHWTKCR